MVVLFRGNHAAGRAYSLHGRLKPYDDAVGLMVHDGLIDMQQRLALSTVGDDQIRLGRQLYMRGKPRAAGAYHARFAHQAGNAGAV